MLQHRFVILVGLLIFCAVPGSFGQDGGSRWLVSPELLGDGNLEILWQNEFPMNESESLERLTVLGNRIYALSDKNYIVSMNRKKGNVIFSRSIAPANFTVVGPSLYKNELLSVISGGLVEIDVDTGAERSAKHLELGVVCPAARNNSYFYVAGSDGRVHALQAGNKIEVFKVSADNESMITSLVADAGFVIFATDAGNVVSITPDRPKRLWQFDAADAIAEPIVKDGKWLFIASKDTNVYKINVITGRFVWKYQTAGILDKGPHVTQKVVYQYVHNKGLTAIDKESGKFMWELPEGVDLLAEANGKAYVITKTGTLVAMDNKKAEPLYSVNFAGVTKYAVNVTDSKIYIADKSGRIACLKPVE